MRTFDQRMLTRALALFAVAVSLLFGTGCAAYVPFTQEIRDQHHLTKDDLKNLQFYTSSRITLRREIESGGKAITGTHKLVVVSGKTIEEVVIEEKTPGVAIDVTDGGIAVSFEPGTSLLFAAAQEAGNPPSFVFAAPPSGRSPNPFPGNNGDSGEAPATSSGFGGTYWLASTQGGTIKFGNLDFTVVDASYKAHLMIASDTLEKVVENRKVLPGMKLK
jgi:hypothetical protein